jgi:hypothetical protein
MLAETGPCLPAPLIHSSTGASVPTAAPRTCQAQLAQKFRHVLHSSKNKKPSALQNNSAHSLSFKSAELSLRPRPPPAPCGSKQNRRKKKYFSFFANFSGTTLGKSTKRFQNRGQKWSKTFHSFGCPDLASLGLRVDFTKWGCPILSRLLRKGGMPLCSINLEPVAPTFRF